MTAINVTDLNNAKRDVDHVAAVATSTAVTVVDRFGHSKPTLAAALAKIGYSVPVPYTAGLAMTVGTQTVEYNGARYAPILSELPFTTSGTFETAKFRVVQGLLQADLEEQAPISVPTLTALRDALSTSTAKTFMVTGYLGTARPAGYAGLFVRCGGDALADDGGLIISDGTNWAMRVIDDAVCVAWWMTDEQYHDVITRTGAVAVDDAWQAAINTRRPVYLIDGKHLLTDSKALFERSRIIGTKGSSANFEFAAVQIAFQPETKRDLFVWDAATLAAADDDETYLYGVYLEGMTIRGFGPGGDALISLPRSYGFSQAQVNGYAGFDVGVRVDYWVDAASEHCSYQGFREYGLLFVNNRGYSTTTRWTNAYISHGPVAIYAVQQSNNSIKVQGTIESVDCIINQEPGNDSWLDLHIENTPRRDGAVFTASRSGATLTVSAISKGRMAEGQEVKRSDTGASLGTIIALGTGTGGTGTYTMSASGTVASMAMNVAGGSAFKLGVDGAQTGVKGTCHITGQIIGYTAGGPTAYPELTKLVETGYIDLVSFDECAIQRFGSLLKTTSQTGRISLDRSTSDNVPKLAQDGELYDLGQVSINNFLPGSMLMPGQDWFTRQPAFFASLELPPTERNTANFYDSHRGKIYRDKRIAGGKLRARDYQNNEETLGRKSAADVNATFNGAKLFKGEQIDCSTIGLGNPVGFVSQLHSKDVAVTVGSCTTAAGNAVVSGGGPGHFANIDVGDELLVSAGFATSTEQIGVVAKASDSSTITMAVAATSSVTGTVTVVYPAHLLAPYSQQGYRSYAASPVGVFVPKFVGEELLDTSGGKKWWRSTGMTTADWV